AGPCDGAIVTSPKCERCDETYWVCEAHSRRPSDFGSSPRACQCGAPAMPCPDCNTDDPPKMPPGFTVTVGGQGAAELGVPADLGDVDGEAEFHFLPYQRCSSGAG